MTDDPHETAKLRAALDAVAAAHQPDPDAWSQISDRAAASGPLTVAAPVADRRRRPWRTALAAAAIVAVAAIGLAVVRTTGNDDVRVGTTPDGKANAPSDATGWYIPVGLPDGWKVTSVTSDRSDDACPCRTTVWANADRSQTLRAGYADAVADDTPALDADPSRTATFDLGGGVEAERYDLEEPLGWDVSWTDDGRSHWIGAEGIALEDAEAIARAVFADPTTRTVPVPGLAFTDEWHEDGEVGRNASVDVTMQAPSGNAVPYSLSGPRTAVDLAATYTLASQLPGQPLPTLTYESRPPADKASTFPVLHDYLGRWPGATVRSAGMRSSDGNGVLTPTDDEVAALMGALRPATTEEWRRFVAQAGNRDRTVTASATLAELIDGSPTRGTTEATDPGSTDPTATNTTAAPVETSTTADPGTTATGRLADLELGLTAEPRLASWEDAGVVLTVRNPTDRPISDPACALDHAGLALIPTDAATTSRVDAIPAGDLWWADAGSCDGGVTVAPGATKTIRLVTRAQFHDARYGPLPSGSYEATARITGVDRALTAPVTVVAQDCSNGAEDYIGLTEAAARALGGERLVRQVRTPGPGTESDVSDERCDRINLVLGPDGRVAFARAY
jgi:hypothetical protein